MKSNTNHNLLLAAMDACDDARVWATDQLDAQAAWEGCERSDWMIWFMARTIINNDDPRLRLLACDFAEAALQFVPTDENRPRLAIEVARRFAAGEATAKELAAAWDAARDAAWAAVGAAVGAAAWAAARAAAGAAAWAAQGAAAWAAQANIIRKYFPECPKAAARYTEALP